MSGVRRPENRGPEGDAPEILEESGIENHRIPRKISLTETRRNEDGEEGQRSVRQMPDRRN
jgi:hypothetical protein